MMLILTFVALVIFIEIIHIFLCYRKTSFFKYLFPFLSFLTSLFITFNIAVFLATWDCDITASGKIIFNNLKDVFISSIIFFGITNIPTVLFAYTTKIINKKQKNKMENISK